jgi:hypothetical protein
MQILCRILRFPLVLDGRAQTNRLKKEVIQ